MNTCLHKLLGQLKKSHPLKRWLLLPHKIFLFILFVSFSFFAKAQNDRLVSGKVVDSTGQALQGVTVSTDNSKKNTVTDNAGNYSIAVTPADKALTFSYVGIKTVTQALTGAGNYNITLSPAMSRLNEVVVVGYGTQRRANVTTAISSVDNKVITERPTTINLAQGLAGKAAGVNVLINSGKPGGSPNIRIRGIGSINSSNTPLYVVDGVVDVDPLTIDPNIIQSVDILKDATASAIYGSRGANGVIVITTKKGGGSTAGITFASNVSFGSLARKVDVLDAYQGLEVIKRAYEYKPGRIAPHLNPQNNFPRKDDLFNPDGTPKYNVDWQDEATRLAVSNNHSLTFSGGQNNFKVLTNITYRNNQGIILTSYEKELNFFTKVGWDVKNWFHVQAIVNSGRSIQNDVEGNAFGQNPIRTMLEYHPFLPVRYPDGTYSRRGDYPGAEQSDNPVNILNNSKSILTRKYTLGNIIGTFNITDKLDFNALISTQTSSANTNSYSSKTLLTSMTQGGIATVTDVNSNKWTAEGYFSYNIKFGDHGLNVVAGSSLYKNTSFSVSTGSEGFFDDFFQYNSLQTGTVRRQPTSSQSENSLTSFYSRINYNYKDKYLLNASFRADGSSRFGANNKFGFFPAFSGAWLVSNEDFFANSSLEKYISNLKLRASFGVVGNEQIGNYVTLSRLGNSQLVFNNTLESSVVLSSLGNPGLKWERSEQTDLGIDIGLLNGRIELTTDVYRKVTKDLLYFLQLPATSGYGGAYDNIGAIQNKGIEISLNSRNISNKSFTWTTLANFSINRSKVLDIYGNILYPFGGIIKEGLPLNTFFGYVRLGTWNTHEEAEAAIYNKKPGDLKYADLNGNKAKDAGDRTTLGNALPKWEANLSNSISYKGFTFLVDLQTRIGNKLANFTRALMENRVTFANSYTSVLDAWTPQNQDTYVVSLRLPGDGYENDVDSRTVEDGSFLRVRNISLNYRINPAFLQKINLQNVTLGVNVENALLITNYAGFDPEASVLDPSQNQGVDLFQYPKSRTVSFSLNARF